MPLLGSLASAALLRSALAAIGVAAPGNCPSAETIQAQLGELLSPEHQQVQHWVFAVPFEGSLWLWFFDAAGNRLGARSLPVHGDCASQALAVAGTIAAFELALQAVAADAPHATPDPAVRQVITSRGTGGKRLEPASASSGIPFAWELGLAPAASLSDGVAPSGEVFAALRRGEGLFLQLRLLPDSERSASLPSGSARWSVQAVALGPGFSLHTGALRWDLALEVGGGLLIARGLQLAQAHTFTAANFGLGAMARLAYQLPARWELWLGLGGVGWLAQQQILVSDRSGGYQVPQWRAQLALGVGWIIP